MLAIGQTADLSFITEQDGVALSPAGTIRIDQATLATTAKGVYAGGDVASAIAVNDRPASRLRRIWRRTPAVSS